MADERWPVCTGHVCPTCGRAWAFKVYRGTCSHFPTMECVSCMPGTAFKADTVANYFSDEFEMWAVITNRDGG